ncbi:MAG: protein phosphatase 2C domain-containing protein, partial [Oscillospiraceae bacterium]|nr:protein phosphatase 2C domain-containing protein [Oscillospiraceae bacterium]
LVTEINNAYQNAVRQKQFSLRCKHIKEVVTEQFSGMSSMLCEMSQELSLTLCDENTENKISGELLKEGVNVREVCCPVDRFGRKSVEFYLLSEDAGKLDDDLIEENISELCGTKMRRESDVKTGDVTRLSFSEEPPYKVKTAYFQKNAEGEKVCGDSFAFLRLNNGFWAAILSDGMGSGKGAALDSKMTVNLVSRFLKLGFPLSNTASLVNSALMIKSEEETLSYRFPPEENKGEANEAPEEKKEAETENIQTENSEEE